MTSCPVACAMASATAASEEEERQDQPCAAHAGAREQFLNEGQGGEASAGSAGRT